MPLKQRFTDIDEHAAQMSGFEQQYVQLSPGPFQGVFSNVAMPRGMGFDVEWVAQALHQQASVPRQTVSLLTFLNLKGRAIFNGHELNDLDTFFVPSGTALDVRTPPNATIAVVTLPKRVVDDEMATWAEPDRPRNGTDATRLLSAAACGTSLQPLLFPWLRALETGPELLSDARVAASMADGLLDAVMTLLSPRQQPGERLEISSAHRRREVFRSARDAIHHLDAAELSIGGLCRIAGVSRRTLEYCFDEAVAMSPMHYLKIKRLNAVRRELATASDASTTIGDVAARHGIWHLSRLSREYGQLFGELPSATLRRGKSSADRCNEVR